MNAPVESNINLYIHKSSEANCSPSPFGCSKLCCLFCRRFCYITCVHSRTSRKRPLKMQTAKRSVFSSKSVKKSVKCGVRILSARSARAHTPVRRVRREKKTDCPYFQRLSPVQLYVFSLVPDLLIDCSRFLETQKYGLFCSLLKLQRLSGRLPESNRRGASSKQRSGHIYFYMKDLLHALLSYDMCSSMLLLKFFVYSKQHSVHSEHASSGRLREVVVYQGSNSKVLTEKVLVFWTSSRLQEGVD